MVIIDEASMIDTLLFYHFLKAIKSPTHLMLVGDIHQLPSVGAGDVLRNLIDSERFVVIQLKKIYRQSKTSHIVTNAHTINNGGLPNFEKNSEDFFLFPAQTSEQAADWVEDLVINRIPNKFGLDPHEDIQVLVPMYRGSAGVNNINARLQFALNPPARTKNEKKVYKTTFREGDKVMQVRNDYEKKVFNGDIGRIKEISKKEQTFLIDYEGHQVLYNWTEGDQFTLAYAISIHKSQGSEFPAVIIPILTEHFMMLQRNLLYTAVTRARNLCIIVSNQQTLKMTVSNNAVAHRYSALEMRLRDLLEKEEFYDYQYPHF
jgi:exodeoxyribonuclease V alpha subunit